MESPVKIITIIFLWMGRVNICSEKVVRVRPMDPPGPQWVETYPLVKMVKISDPMDGTLITINHEKRINEI